MQQKSYKQQIDWIVSYIQVVNHARYCMGAIYWANFKDVYYAYSSEEEEQAGLGTSHVYAQLALPREEREVQLQHVERQAETNDAFALWIEKQQ